MEPDNLAKLNSVDYDRFRFLTVYQMVLAMFAFVWSSSTHKQKNYISTIFIGLTQHLFGKTVLLKKPFSVVLFIIFMNRISLCSQRLEGIWFGTHRISFLLFADYVVLLTLSS